MADRRGAGSLGSVGDMLNPRPSAWALVVVLVGGLVAPAAGNVAQAAPAPVCTGWTDPFHPPPTIRVLRKTGPNAGGVEVVDFWTYVAVVLRTEYGNGVGTKADWMRVGAITVKQYGWYYSIHWRGGKALDGSCFDVRDTTADQLYRPEKWDAATGTWVPRNVPVQANFDAMRETWHVTLRKWVPKKHKSRLFLTGYRAGYKRPCGTDATGFKILQKSLRDCLNNKGLNLEEVLRKYFEPKLEIVDARGNDVLADDDQWYGDVGVLSPSGSDTRWRVYPGAADGFGSAVTGDFNLDISKILDHGSGDVSGDRLADVVLLVNGNSGRKLRTARATGTGYGELETQDVPSGVSGDRLLVADFNGDLRSDVGLVRSTPTAPPAQDPATLVVMRSLADGTFGAPVDWWRGALDLSDEMVMAGDVNGDGMADLVIRDASASVGYRVAPSFASCTDFAAWGPCTASQGDGLAAAVVWLGASGWSAGDLKHAVTDFNRDGRDDLMVVARTGAGIKVFALRSQVTTGFAAPELLWQGGIAFGDVVPVGMHVNADGLGDLAMLQRNGSGTQLFWLRSIAKTKNPASMTATSATSDPSLAWSAAGNLFY
jgi:hypothetical protein